LYKELQFALRAAVGTRTLDELLENKSVIDNVVSEQIKRRVALRFGGRIGRCEDIILPGEMKLILLKWFEAERLRKQRHRRREETCGDAFSA